MRDDEMKKYFDFWQNHIRSQLGLEPHETPSITKEEWDKMSPKEKVKFIRASREERRLKK